MLWSTHYSLGSTLCEAALGFFVPETSLRPARNSNVGSTRNFPPLEFRPMPVFPITAGRPNDASQNHNQDNTLFRRIPGFLRSSIPELVIPTINPQKTRPE